MQKFNTSEDLVGDLADLGFTQRTVNFYELVEGECLWGSYICHNVDVLMLLIIHFQASTEILIRNKNLINPFNSFKALRRVINTSEVPNLVQSTLHLQMRHLDCCHSLHNRFFGSTDAHVLLCEAKNSLRAQTQCEKAFS